MFTVPTTATACNASTANDRRRLTSVKAFNTVKQSTFGCFHPEAAGVLPQDVHVIDLKTMATAAADWRRRRRDVDALTSLPPPPPRVEVDLLPSPGKFF
jgi:hypothetical protein